MKTILIAFAIYLLLLIVGIAVAWYEVKHAIEIDKDDKNF